MRRLPRVVCLLTRSLPRATRRRAHSAPSQPSHQRLCLSAGPGAHKNRAGRAGLEGVWYRPVAARHPAGSVRARHASRRSRPPVGTGVTYGGRPDRSVTPTDAGRPASAQCRGLLCAAPSSVRATFRPTGGRSELTHIDRPGDRASLHIQTDWGTERVATSRPTGGRSKPPPSDQPGDGASRHIQTDRGTERAATFRPTGERNERHLQTDWGTE